MKILVFGFSLSLSLPSQTTVSSQIQLEGLLITSGRNALSLNSNVKMVQRIREEFCKKLFLQMNFNFGIAKNFW